MPRRPNLIILCTDEFRGDCLGANGLNADLRTPRLDGLAERGVNFTRHFATFPKCVPARISLMTGRYCHTDGFRTITQHLPFGQPDLLSCLLRHGYQAALCGKNHCWEHLLEASHRPPTLRPGQRGLAVDHHSWTRPLREHWERHRAADQARPDPPRPAGYTDAQLEFVSNRSRHWADECYTDQAIDFLTRRRDRDRPFFLQVNLEAPHPAYGADEPWFSLYRPESITPFPTDLPANAPLPMVKQREVRTGGCDESVFRAIQACYYGMCARIDDQLGRLIDTLDAEGLFADSIVLLWSDHGDFAGQYGLPEKWDTVFADCLIHVPCVLCAPGLPAGRTVTTLSDHTDLAPTLLELLGLPPLPGLHGRSLLPAIDGRPVRDAVFADGGHEDEMLGRFGFYREPPPTRTVGSGKQETYRLYPDTMARAKMVRTATHKLVVRRRGGNELYDLTRDRWELDNRWGDPALAEVTTDLQGKLLQWCLETDPDRPHQAVVGA